MSFKLLERAKSRPESALRDSQRRVNRFSPVKSGISPQKHRLECREGLFDGRSGDSGRRRGGTANRRKPVPEAKNTAKTPIPVARAAHVLSPVAAIAGLDYERGIKRRPRA